MSDIPVSEAPAQPKDDWLGRLGLGLAFVLVLVGMANNLTVGETVEPQQGRKVLGFLCDGVVTRINFQGIMRPDEICRGCVIPWWTKEEFIAASTVGAATGIIIEQPPEPSPSRP